VFVPKTQIAEFRSCWAFSWAVKKVTLRFARYCSVVMFPSFRALSRPSTTWDPSASVVCVRLDTVSTSKSPNSCIILKASFRWGKRVG